MTPESRIKSPAEEQEGEPKVRFSTSPEVPDSEHGPTAGTWWLPQEEASSNNQSQARLNNLPEETPWVLDIYNADWILAGPNRARTDKHPTHNKYKTRTGSGMLGDKTAQNLKTYK